MSISVGPPGLERRLDGGPPHNMVERVKIHTDLERFNRENKPRHPFQVRFLAILDHQTVPIGLV